MTRTGSLRAAVARFVSCSAGNRCIGMILGLLSFSVKDWRSGIQFSLSIESGSWKYVGFEQHLSLVSGHYILSALYSTKLVSLFPPKSIRSSRSSLSAWDSGVHLDLNGKWVCSCPKTVPF